MSDKLEAKGVGDTQLPPLSMVLDSKDKPMGKTYFYFKNKVWITKTHLERISKLDIDEEYSLKGNNGVPGKKETLFKGTMLNMFFLHGAEECYHAIYDRHNGQDVEPESSYRSTAEHDAKRNEYEALRWMIKIAQEKQMPSGTIKVLKKRLAAAKDLRRR